MSAARYEDNMQINNSGEISHKEPVGLPELDGFLVTVFVQNNKTVCILDTDKIKSADNVAKALNACANLSYRERLMVADLIVR